MYDQGGRKATRKGDEQQAAKRWLGSHAHLALVPVSGGPQLVDHLAFCATQHRHVVDDAVDDVEHKFAVFALSDHAVMNRDGEGIVLDHCAFDVTNRLRGHNTEDYQNPQGCESGYFSLRCH